MVNYSPKNKPDVITDTMIVSRLESWNKLKQYYVTQKTALFLTTF